MRRTSKTMGLALAAALTCTAVSGYAWAAPGWTPGEEGTVSAVIQADTVVTDGTVQVTFDPQKLTYVGCDFVGDQNQYQPCVAMHAVNDGKAQQGQVTIAWVAPGEYDLEGSAQDLFQINFQAKGETVTADDLTVSGSANDPQGHAVEVALAPVTPGPVTPTPAPTPAPTDAPETQPTAVPEAKPTQEPVTPPETGDQAQLGLYLALAAAAAGSLTLAGVFNQQRRGKR